MKSLSDFTLSHIPWATFGLSESQRDFDKKYQEQQDWVRLFAFPEKITLVLVDDEKIPERQLNETLRSILSQSFPHWELYLALGNRKPSVADPRIITVKAENALELKNKIVERVQGKWLGFVEPGDALSPVALYLFALEIKKHRDTEFLYCNEAELSKDSKSVRRFFSKSKMSAFNLFHFNAIGKFWLIKTEIFRKLKGLDADLANSEWEFIIRLMKSNVKSTLLPVFLYYRREKKEANQPLPPVFLSKLKAHLAGTPFDGDLKESGGRIKISPKIKPKLVSVVICFRNRSEDTLRCLKALSNQMGKVPLEVFLVNNQSENRELQKIKEMAKHFPAPIEVIDYDHPFNYGNMHNHVIRNHCRGDVLFLLNNDVFLSGEKTLDELASWAQQEETGTVGFRLNYPDGNVQYAGMRVFFGGTTRMVRSGNVQEQNALTYQSHELFANSFAACLFKRALFETVGGFRELDLANGFGDLAFNFECLKRGKKNIYLGHIEGVHVESASRQLNNHEYWEDCILEKEYTGILQEMLREDLGYGRIPREEKRIPTMLFNKIREVIPQGTRHRVKKWIPKLWIPVKAILLVGLCLSAFSKAENLSPSDVETLNMLRARAEQEKMQQDFQNPKTPEIGKDRATSGDKSAPILIVEYSDFQCPYCRQGYLSLEEVRKKYGKKIRFVFKHFPLPMHPLALPAAKRFEAIAMQSAKKAYKFHDEVFKNQDGLNAGGEEFLDSVAKKVGADVKKMKKDMESEKVREHIGSDTTEARKFGITGTPGFIVAGIGLYGAYPAESFYPIIDQRLKELKK